MNIQTHDELKAKIWEIANRLRGPYRPPQYRLVMLPMVVLRRLDCVLEPTKDAVLQRREALMAQQMPEVAMDRLLGKAADPNRKHPLYNTSPYTFARLLGDAENIAPNLVSYINGFSPTARRIFERFKFADQIEKLDASNRLFTIVKAMADVDLHPNRIDNLQMGYVFEHLVMRFNEQANEEAGDHFTPREVIRLMANLIYTGEQDVYRPGIFRTIYDPACGTGGMLSESEKLILSQNARAQLALYGQEYNDEAWAICCSDMLIKDEDTANIVLGDTLGDGKTRDGFEGRRFHYMKANPPFGVEWKDQKDVVEREHNTLGFAGRFRCRAARHQRRIAAVPPAHDLQDASLCGGGRGPARLQDRHRLQRLAALLRRRRLGPLQHPPLDHRERLARRHRRPAGPALLQHRHLYLRLAGDQPQAVRAARQGAAHRRHPLLPENEEELEQQAQRDHRRPDPPPRPRLRQHHDGETAQVPINGGTETRVISRLFENREFGFLKVTVERPLRMNFEASPERIARLDDQSAFANLATSKKRKDKDEVEREIEEGRKLQDAIRAALATLGGKGRYRDRAVFEADLTKAAKHAGLKLPAPVKKTIFAALGERDPEAAICRDAKGQPEPDSELRDTENIPLPSGTMLPLPMDFGPDKPNDRLIAAFRGEIEAYIAREVLPHVPDAWVDYDKTKVGYEIPINRHFYVYKPPRPLDQIKTDITTLEGEIAGLLKGLVA